MDSGVALALWGLGTVGHFLLTARWVGRTGGALTRDERWFRTMVLGTAGLSIALHFVAAAAGLTLTRVLLALAAGHGFVAWRIAGWHTATALPPATDRITRALELAAILTIIAVVAQWFGLAVPTLEVSGTDAAHYHVPNAVNLALGSRLFDLPPTPHLYPMGSSALAAWFILPLRTTLLTDLVMVLPFLLFLSAAGYLFRLLTTLSGLAWATWMSLALFATPLFRYASLMSADLLFAASSLALAGALLAPIIRRRLTSSDVWLVALSAGLLLGTKITGVATTGLLGVPALAALVVQRLRGSSTPALAHERLSAVVWAGAAVAAVGAGGIWLLRNWWVWGSPIAPNGLTLFGIALFPGPVYEATTYNSVLGDMAEVSNYRLRDRSIHYIDLWLGSWYLLGVSAMVLIPIDAVAGWWRDVSRAQLAVRLWAFIVAFGTAAVMGWFLIGAPWASLEWTRGLSLRYGLPWLAVLPLIAWVGMFPASLPWYRRPILAALGGVVACGGGLAMFGAQQPPLFPPLPTLGSLAAALVVWATIKAATYDLRRSSFFGASGMTASVVAASLALAGSIGFGIWAGAANARTQEARTAEMSNWPQSKEDRVYDAALKSEVQDGRTCTTQGRRFFVTTRLNQPMALQGVLLANRVYYAARDVRVTATVRPVMGPCDYIITDAAVLGTTKGANLHAALSGSATLTEAAHIDTMVLLVRR